MGQGFTRDQSQGDGAVSRERKETKNFLSEPLRPGHLPGPLAWNCPGPGVGLSQDRSPAQAWWQLCGPKSRNPYQLLHSDSEPAQAHQVGDFLTCQRVEGGDRRQRFPPAEKEDVNPRSSVFNEVKISPSLSPANLTGRVTQGRGSEPLARPWPLLGHWGEKKRS